MTRWIRSYVVSACLLAATFLAMPPSSHAAEAETSPRVAVGQIAPDFTLPDPDGTDFAAATLRGEKNLLVVFFRGAW